MANFKVSVVYVNDLFAFTHCYSTVCYIPFLLLLLLLLITAL
jgi:hypothetical protein